MKRKILFSSSMCDSSRCLLCGTSVVKRKFNVKRHYKNKHASTYDSIVRDDRRKMIDNLKKPLSNDVSSITTFNNKKNKNNNIIIMTMMMIIIIMIIIII